MPAFFSPIQSEGAEIVQGEVARWDINYPDGALSFVAHLLVQYNARKMAAKAIS